MATQSYNISITHAHEMLKRSILYRIIHVKAPYLGDINGDLKSEFSTLLFKQGKKLEGFHGRILRIQKDINLS